MGLGGFQEVLGGFLVVSGGVRVSGLFAQLKLSFIAVRQDIDMFRPILHPHHSNRLSLSNPRKYSIPAPK